MFGPLLLMRRFGPVRARAGQPGAEHVEHLDGVACRQSVIDVRGHGVEAGARRLGHHVCGVADVVDVVADAAGQAVDAGAVQQDVIGIDAGDRHRHGRGIAPGDGVGERIGHGEVGRARAGCRQIVEQMVGIIAERAVGIDRQERSRRQRELGAERAARHRRHLERTVGVAVGTGPVVGEHVPCRDRGVLCGRQRVILRHRRIVDGDDLDRRRGHGADRGAVEYAPAQRARRIEPAIGRIVAGGAELDRLNEGLIIGNRRRASECEGVQEGVVGEIDAEEAAGLQAVHAQNVAVECAVGDSDRARDQAEVVDVGHARARRYRQRRIVLGIDSGCGGRQVGGVVDGDDIDGRGRGRDRRAVRHGPGQRALRIAVEIRRIVAGRFKRDGLQQRLVVRDRARAG